MYMYSSYDLTCIFRHNDNILKFFVNKIIISIIYYSKCKNNLICCIFNALSQIYISYDICYSLFYTKHKYRPKIV